MDTGVLALALLAGAVAAFNPCGFALLPAYLGLLVSGPDRGRGAAVRGAVRFATGMTAGFVVVFGLAGAVLAPLAISFERYLPVVTVVMGVLLVALGGWLLAGRQLAIPGLAGRGRPPTETWSSQLAYGVSFALASLSCTLAPFLAVTAGSLRAGGPGAVAATFVVYALGMGSVVLALAVAVALARTSLVGSMRRIGGVVSRASGVLLLLAGAYVAWYGWFEIRVLAGATTSDPVVDAAVDLQGALTRAVAGLGPGGVAVTGLVTALAVAVLALRARRRRAAGTPEEPIEEVVP